MRRFLVCGLGVAAGLILAGSEGGSAGGRVYPPSAAGFDGVGLEQATSVKAESKKAEPKKVELKRAEPAAPSQAGKLQRAGEVFLANGNASGLVRSGDYLYMVLNESTHPLVVYDIREASQPRVIRHLPAPGWPMRCRLVAPGWLWTVHGNGEGFFDLEEPGHPRRSDQPQEGPPLRRLSRTAFRVHPNFTYSSCAWETTLFYGTEKSSTAIYDIRDPDKPRLLAELPEVVPVLYQDHWLFTTGKAAPVQVYDVRAPSRPVLLGQIVPPPDWPFHLRGSAVAYAPPHLYVGIRRDLPKLFGRGPLEQAQSGIAVFDVRDWRQPRLLGFAWVEEAISDITTLAVKDGYVYASDAAFGLRVLDARQPAQPRWVTADRQGGELSAAVLLPQRGLIALGQNISGSVFVVDTREPDRPQRRGFFHHGLRVWGQMAASADERYVYFQADISRPRPGFSGLFTLDVQDPEQPRLASLIPDVRRAYGLLRLGDYLYSSGGDIFELRPPGQPRRLSTRLPVSGYQIAHHAGHLYVASFAENDGQGRLFVLQCDKPDQPRLVGQLPLPLGHRVISMAFLHGRLYLGWAYRSGEARRPRGLLVEVDISQPKQPRLLRQFDAEKDLQLTAHYCHVAPAGRYLLVGSYHRKIGLYDVQPGSAPPRCLAHIDGLPSAWWMVAQDHRLYRVCLDRLLVLHLQPPPPSP
jgi:hypothetical protein